MLDFTQIQKCYNHLLFIFLNPSFCQIFILNHFLFIFPLQEVEQLRLERMQIDEQLRQITQGHRPSDRERGERGERGGGGYNTDSSANASSSSLHGTRSYNSRGRGRRGHSYSTGYGRKVKYCKQKQVTHCQILFKCLSA